MSTGRKTVLFVDDDVQFLEMIGELARQHTGNAWQVLSAQTTALALTLLQAHRVDLLILDWRMPVLDGVQFLQLIQSNHQRVRKIVLSGFLDEGARATARAAGAELVLDKPLAPDGFHSVLAAAAELLKSTDEGFQGVLRRVGIEDVIQLECLSRHSLILEVSAGSMVGRIFIRRGELLHAECGHLAGEAALQQLLSLAGGQFQHQPFAEPPMRTLHGSWEFLVMEAVRKRDEAASPEAAVNDGAPLPGVTEMVVCAEDGEVLHAWQSEDATARRRMLATLQDAAQRLQSVLPLGPMERVEFPGAPERTVARFSSQGALFVRGTSPAE